MCSKRWRQRFIKRLHCCTPGVMSKRSRRILKWNNIYLVVQFAGSGYSMLLWASIKRQISTTNPFSRRRVLHGGRVPVMPGSLTANHSSSGRPDWSTGSVTDGVEDWLGGKIMPVFRMLNVMWKSRRATRSHGPSKSVDLQPPHLLLA